jgi:hypothetical protein
MRSLLNRRQRKLLVWGAAVVAAVILIGTPVLYGWLWFRPVSLPEWIERVRRANYRLIYSSEATDHSYYAIFDAGDNRLAFCHLHKSAQPSSTILDITIDGEDVMDTKHRQYSSLNRSFLGVYSVTDGVELPIKPGVAGKLRVRYEVDDHDILDTEIPWVASSQP